MNIFRHFLILVFFLSYTHAAVAEEKTSIGWVEKVKIDQGRILLNAKIDTGADNSSITAKSVVLYEKDNSNWVKLVVSDFSGDDHTIVRPVTKFVRIKRKGTSSQRRPVIKLGICLDNAYREVDVSVTNSNGYKYNMLVGRSYLKGLFVVDADIVNTTIPSCHFSKE